MQKQHLYDLDQQDLTSFALESTFCITPTDFISKNATP